MSDIEYLSLDDVIEFVRLLKVGPVRDLGLLDSALHRPRSTAFGEDIYPTIEMKAGAILHSLVGNHALVDGNKRLGLLSLVVFLDLNGYDLDLGLDETYSLIMEIAATDLGVEDVAKRLTVLENNDF